MNSLFATERLKALLGFPFRDPKAGQKFLIGSLLIFAQYIIPILPGIIVMGYLSQVLRRVTRGSGEATMPEWDNWGELFMDGLKVFGAIFVYSLPMILIVSVLYFLMFAPLAAVPFLAEGNSDMAGLAIVLVLIAQLFMFLMIAVMMVVYIVYIILLPPMQVHTAAKNEFGAAFQIGKWWKIFRANFSGFMIALIIIIGVYALLMIGVQILYMTLVLCFLIPFVTAPVTFYIGLITYALLGEVYRVGEEKAFPTEAVAEIAA